MVNNPTVSVILPVYNGENYLRLAIESVLAQSFRDFELIVVDDGSKDSTPEVARSYGERLRYVRQQNTGVAGAFNHGLRLARGRYISWLSHDDVFLPAKLERQVEALKLFDDPAVCYTDVQTIDSTGTVRAEQRLPTHDRSEILRHVLTVGAVCMASYSVVYDRRCIEVIGNYSERWRHTQDVDMLMRLARQFPFAHVSEPLMQVREHGERGVRSKDWQEEVVRFFRARLAAVPLEELFPEMPLSTRRARAEAYLWLAETFAERPFPLYKVAFSQYRRALGEDPSQATKILGAIAALSVRHVRMSAARQRVRLGAWTKAMGLRGSRPLV